MYPYLNIFYPTVTVTSLYRAFPLPSPWLCGHWAGQGRVSCAVSAVETTGTGPSLAQGHCSGDTSHLQHCSTAAAALTFDSDNKAVIRDNMILRIVFTISPITIL